ncbi:MULTISPECIES: HypC/HybG/HupF family hydrogenase formation chaperone [unclassified Nonomuraea]|uniref:HypC/HybG/HupF family hydrogenase formation chaperone n=1 Tax=unclassified Nonomuraea TaxID=2593643 RepID=UPI001486D1AC|nr:HypC/HybG/HupF family hydrogenase formation chaperone [Nonomuraea sp. KC401]
MSGGGDDEAGPVCDSCVTCGDVAVLVRVVGLLPGGLALADASAGAGAGAVTKEISEGTSEEISVALVEARVGDTVLVHAGEAIAVVERPGA